MRVEIKGIIMVKTGHHINVCPCILVNQKNMLTWHCEFPLRSFSFDSIRDAYTFAKQQCEKKRYFWVGYRNIKTDLFANIDPENGFEVYGYPFYFLTGGTSK